MRPTPSSCAPFSIAHSPRRLFMRTLTRRAMRLDKRSAFFQPPSTNGRQRLAAEITPIRLNGQKRVHQDDGDNRPWPDLDLDLAKDDRKSPPPFDEAVFSPALLEWASRTA